MTNKTLVLLTALLFVSLAYAKDKTRDWKTGTLVDVRTDRGSRVVGSGGNVATHRDDRMYYSIDDGKFLWEISRSMTSRGDKSLRVTVNTEVQFVIDGDDAYLKDEDGKEHKLSLEKKTAKLTTNKESATR